MNLMRNIGSYFSLIKNAYRDLLITGASPKYKLYRLFIVIIYQVQYLYYSKYNIFYGDFNHYFIFCFFLVLAWKPKSSILFLKDWVPILIFISLHVVVWSNADNYAPFYNTTLMLVHLFENDVLHIYPGFEYLQKYNNIFLNSILVNIYYTFYYVPYLLMFYIWVWKRALFKRFIIGFFAVSSISIFIFFLFPTAPPWIASQVVGIEISRVVGSDISIIDFDQIAENTNLVAAFPSLHVGWTAYCVLFMMIFVSRKYAIGIVYIAAMSVAVILLGEHYIVDVLFGILISIVVLLISKNSLRQKKLT